MVISHTYELDFFASGVQIFFFISGFLMTNLRLEMNLKGFILYRAVRLFPLAIFMSILFFFRFGSPFELTANLLLIQTLIPNFSSFPGGWSISYEWLFSLLLIPIILLKSKAFRLTTLIILILIMIYSDILTHATLNNGQLIFIIAQFLGNAAFLFLGVCLNKEDLKIFKLNKIAMILILLSIFVISNYISNYLTLWFIYVFCLVSLVLTLPTKIKFNSKKFNSFVEFIGKRTYGLFCGHFIAMIALGNIKIDDLIFQSLLRLKVGYFFGSTLFFLIVFALASIFAFFSYKYLEVPTIRWIKKFIVRRKL